MKYNHVGKVSMHTSLLSRFRCFSKADIMSYKVQIGLGKSLTARQEANKVLFHLRPIGQDSKHKAFCQKIRSKGSRLTRCSAEVIHWWQQENEQRNAKGHQEINPARGKIVAEVQHGCLSNLGSLPLVELPSLCRKVAHKQSCYDALESSSRCLSFISSLHFFFLFFYGSVVVPTMIPCKQTQKQRSISVPSTP